MLTIRQDQTYMGDHWWKWSVRLEGPENELNEVSFVDWILHPTFPDPVRRVDTRANNFCLETGGWGTFQLEAKIQLHNGTQTELTHFLQLHIPEADSQR